jgi:hypothetical protein
VHFLLPFPFLQELIIGDYGLVTMAVPAMLHGVLAGQFPEATWALLPHERGSIAREAAEVLTKNFRAGLRPLLIGPGFGMEDTTQGFLEDLLTETSASNKPSARIGFLQDQEEKKEDTATHLPPISQSMQTA